MPNTYLTINDKTSDLSDEYPVALNFQVNDIADLKDRQATFSNTIKLPKTHNNCQIFGNAQEVPFTQSQPYIKLPCFLIQSGQQTIPNGVISLLRVNDYFEAQITYGLTGLIDALKYNTYDPAGNILTSDDGTLKNLNWSDIPNFNYNQAAKVANLQMFPVIDYGQTLSNSSKINSTYLRPGVTFQQIFDRIQKYTGYKFFGGAAYTAGLSYFIPFAAIDLIDYQGTKYYQTNLPLSIVNNLPDFKLKDVLKDFMWRHFLTPVVDNFKKTVYFKSFDDLYTNIANAKDWTQKFVKGSREDSFDLNGYAQTNKLLFTTDENTYGNSLFNVRNQNLEVSTELLTSIFSSSNNLSFIGLPTVATITTFKATPLPNYGTQPDIATKPRVVRLVRANGNYLYDDGTTLASVTNPYYGIFDGWDYYLKNYAQGFLRLLKKPRVVTRQIILNEVDVQNFDFFTPIYDAKDASYYYCNKISNFQPGKVTSISLVKM